MTVYVKTAYLHTDGKTENRVLKTISSSVKFYPNPPSRFGARLVTDRQSERQTKNNSKTMSFSGWTRAGF